MPRNHSGSGSESDSDLEAERARIMAQNREKLLELGIAESKREMTARRVYPLRERRPSQAASAPPPKRQRRAQTAESGDDSEDEGRARYRPVAGSSTIFDEDHVRALGTYTEPFEKDYSEEYLKADSTTCHQCRQKITGPKTECCECKSMRGQFCGKCLFNRYGENMYEQQGDWVCPGCRDMCNCSFCYRATGQLVNKARKLGYLSAAHMIVLTNLQEHLECLEDRAGDVFVVRDTRSGSVLRVLPRYRKGRLAAVPDTPNRSAGAAAAAGGPESPSSATHS